MNSRHSSCEKFRTMWSVAIRCIIAAYRTTDNFILYSVGWNETDDGGVVVFKQRSSSDVDISQGDWVWQYPQK